MYTNFFSLSELPFSIAPDPKYLFMSDRHREALTHLTHGLGGSNVSSNGGFVLLTGEVGTGKTTVSRCLMADLPENTQLAFILNPTLSSQELLATICDQLKIRYRKTGATLKTLTDKISEKLLKNHVDDINTLLIIDEAQHLEPQVLEQLRLLTNLETNTNKLLQVILIGQPELQQLLKRRDLRQLAQRITARYHLLPLDKNELALYIKHRLSVADCHRALFNKSAIAAIHQLSQGIPRLINLICHSALMEAYNSNNAVIDKKIVLKAASQALGDDFLPPIWWQHKNMKTALITSMLFVVLITGFWLGQTELSLVANSELPKKAAEQVIPVKVEPQKIQQAALKNEPEEIVTALNSNNKVIVPITETLVKKEPEQKVVSAELNTTVTHEAKVDDNYQIEAVKGVSDDLLARFQMAMDETKDQPVLSQKAEVTNSVASEVQSLTQMPAWVQNGVPSLHVEQHIYASNGQGWVNVNGRDRYQGDMITAELQLTEILPQQIILKYRGEVFSLPALTNW
ncbi:AAA family ATPase [Candidatus Colwellia aromaticivorans]|uniref:AAA family ATPase n=1 Tax=Candidatus Colwellia aromaticivorans TaxID=2267621 RepID=UPI000DF401A2|nr:AAA family ATPase [Candidatus Colwellia aromaticivorans]